jgi:hypothetical protein
MNASSYTLRQYAILDTLADDSEVFFYLFSAANAAGSASAPARSSSEGPTVSGSAVADDVFQLIRAGLVSCLRVKETAAEPIGPEQLTTSEFSVYSGYSCTSFDQHYDLFGLGPHQFSLTGNGRCLLEQWVPPEGYGAP